MPLALREVESLFTCNARSHFNMLSDVVRNPLPSKPSWTETRTKRVLADFLGVLPVSPGNKYIFPTHSAPRWISRSEIVAATNIFPQFSSGGRKQNTLHRDSIERSPFHFLRPPLPFLHAYCSSFRGNVLPMHSGKTSSLPLSCLHGEGLPWSIWEDGPRHLRPTDALS